MFSYASEFKVIRHYLFYQVRVSGFMLKSLTHLELKFVLGSRNGLIWIFQNVVLQFDHYNLLKILPFSPVCISVFFIKKILGCIDVAFN